MKQIIRSKTFETNSSSMHSLTLEDHDEISSLLYEIKDLVDEAEDIDDIYKALAKLKIVEHLLIENIYRRDD